MDAQRPRGTHRVLGRAVAVEEVVGGRGHDPVGAAGHGTWAAALDGRDVGLDTGELDAGREVGPEVDHEHVPVGGTRCERERDESGQAVSQLHHRSIVSHAVRRVSGRA